MIRIDRILYPTDFSSHSTQAYFHAIALAEKHQATLTVLFVYHPDMITPGEPPDEESALTYWAAQLQQIRPLNPSIPIHHVLLTGDPSTRIVEYARDAGIDLIVMGTHGRTGVERCVMGSVAERVLSNADSSVLVVKMPKDTLANQPGDPFVAVGP